tara:strand:+ start:1009 stop:1218 length:210 start_codon:yes stop_codon:yes gene_type:complete
MRYIFAALIGISFAALLSACSFMPPPLNDPHVSTFGKKCNEKVWSYIWITKRGENLTASEENCKIPIKK